MKFLVTGGAGFIGSNIVDRLVESGHTVRVLDNFSTGKKEHLKKSKNKIDLIEGDIRDINLLKKIIKNIDFVIHQAALRAVQRSVDNPSQTNDVNITGTLNLLIACKENKVKRLIFASSSSVYGDNDFFPQNENLPPKPLSPYAVTKLTGEYYCRVFYKTFNVETVCLRYFNVFGPRQNPHSKYAAVIPIFINQIKQNKPLTIHSDGKQSRDFTYIENVVDATIKAVFAKNAQGKVFNIACGNSISILEIAKNLEKITNKKLKKIFLPPRQGDVKKTFADISQAKKILGYIPKVDFLTGLKYTWNYFNTEWKK